MIDNLKYSKFQGVQELFSDILYDSDEQQEEYKDDFEDVDDENNWSDESPHPLCISASSALSRSDNFQYLPRSNTFIFTLMNSLKTKIGITLPSSLTVCKL